SVMRAGARTSQARMPGVWRWEGALATVNRSRRQFSPWYGPPARESAAWRLKRRFGPLHEPIRFKTEVWPGRWEPCRAAPPTFRPNCPWYGPKELASSGRALSSAIELLAHLVGRGPRLDLERVIPVAVLARLDGRVGRGEIARDVH